MGRSLSARKCQIDDCGERHLSGGFCGMHYRRSRLGTDMMAPKSNRGGNAIATTVTRDTVGRKFCKQCGRWLEESHFGRSSSSVDGLTTYCKGCMADHRQSSAFGIPISKLHEMRKSQDGLCYLCGGGQADGINLAIDHDHSCCPGKKSCGKCVRKLLCNKCNTGLGSFGDDIDLMRRAIEYLEMHKTALD